MEIFVEVKSILRLLGFLQFEHPKKKLINLIQNIIHGCCLTINTASTIYFLSGTFVERSESFLNFNVTVFLVNLYCIFKYKREEIMTTITLLEEKIQQRM